MSTMSQQWLEFSKKLEASAYDDTTAQECAARLHAASLAAELARALEAVGAIRVEGPGAGGSRRVP
jgi:hypothetical protein